ncbi:hypothetical protein ACA910_007584 [Epithemia clementina (nom. ined.)]
MSSFHKPKPGSTKACGSFRKKNGAESTIDTLKHLEDEILPFDDLGFRLNEVQVFWLPMDRKAMTDNVRGRDWMRTNDSSSNDVNESGTDKATESESQLKKLLEPARPPDSMIGYPQWRWCHMGLILSASSSKLAGDEKTGTSTRLYIILDLYQTGVRTDHLLVRSSLMHNKLKKLVINHCNQEEVFSAGINQPTTSSSSDLGSLLEHVQMFSECSYNPAFFNCQHFTSILFQRLTGENLSKCLRHRWTSNKSLQGDNPNIISYVPGLSLAMKDHSLKGLCIVDIDELLFSYSCRLFGKSNQAAAGVGAAGIIAGGLMAATRAGSVGGPIAALGAAVAAIGLGYDKVPSLCPLSRATIWFQYCRETAQWYWSPYRCGEVEAIDRWISVKTLKVSEGPYQGQEIQNTSAGIALYLARRNPFPLADCHFECPICFEDWYNSDYVLEGRCGHQVCADCHAKLIASNMSCPFCRQAF